MQSHIVVAAVDEAEFRRMGLDFPPVLCDATGRTHGADPGAEVPLSEVMLNALCVLATSTDGLRSAEAFCTRFGAELGAEPPLLVDLSATRPDERRDSALGEIVAALLQERASAARRQTELLRDLAHLRASHAELLESFGLLEGFVREAKVDHRQMVRDLAPAAHTEPVAIVPGGTLRQRLPRKSSGICDLGLHLARSPDSPDGTLRVELFAAETGSALHTWTLPAAELTPGWLRLPLDIALGPDDATVEAHLHWTGTAPLALDWSLRHPDPRYCLRTGTDTPADGDDRVLALRIWTYIPGCAAPLPGDGVEAAAQGVRSVPRELLMSARNLNPGNTDTRFLDQAGVLQVHPVQGDLAAVLLPEAVSPGIAEISADIRSLSDQAPDIEFAIALAPVSARLDPSSSGRGLMRRRGPLRPAMEALLETPGARMSEWYRLSATAKGHIDLPLPAPTEAAMDLYLITRMADPTARPSWAWAAFSGVTLRRDRG